VTFAWIFFRTDDGIRSALGYIKHIGVSIIEHPGQFLMLPGGKMAFVYIFPLVLGDWYLRRDERKLLVSNKKIVRYSIYCFFGILILVELLTYLNTKPSSFIYFQF
jgi:hypothetical protein